MVGAKVVPSRALRTQEERHIADLLNANDLSERALETSFTHKCARCAAAAKSRRCPDEQIAMG
jgi:hypothetical protein